MPAVSIILTVKGSSAHFDACVQGILGQTLSDFEVLCIHSWADAHASAVLEDLAARDGRFRLYASDALGRTFTWKDALNFAEAPYVCLVDDTTVMDAQMLERLYQLATRLDLDVALCTGMRADESEAAPVQVSGPYIQTDLLPLYEGFGADEVPQRLFEAVPLRSWDRLYRRDWLLGALPQGIRTSSVDNTAIAMAALAQARHIDWVDDVLVRHYGCTDEPVDETLAQLGQVRQHLVDAGIYPRFERDFVNHVASLLLEKAADSRVEAQLAWRAKLPAACDELGIADKKRAFFYQGSTYDQLHEQLSWGHPAVTVLMPSLNVAPFIRQCVESVLAQTLVDIEVLCIDAGSTDGTLEILREYERTDPRVRVIVSDMRSYGHQMNLGLAAARGEFIGIVETDDYADPQMFETLYRQAKRLDAQVVKGNYYDFRTKPVVKNVFHRSYYRLPYGCLLTQDERIEVLRRIPCIWSGIYQTKMLRDNSIGFLETPGASYQDTSFTLKVWATVERAVLDEHAFLHYRNDNEASSVRQSDKVYYVNGEFESAHEYCVARHGSASGYTKSLRCRQAVAYLWNFNRIADEFKPEYVERMREEFAAARDAGELDKKYFWQKEWDAVHQLLDDPEGFLSERMVAPAQEAPEGSEPLLTLVVDTRGCAEGIATCVESLARQDLVGVEVVLMDDGTDASMTKRLNEVAGELPEGCPVRITGKPIASRYNDVVATVRGTWIVFFDGNSALEIDALKSLKGRLAASTADVVLLQHDVFDLVQGELVARGQGVELGARRGLEVVNVQHGQRSLLQMTDMQVVGKAFRKRFVEEAGLRFLKSEVNPDSAFCALGMLRAQAVEVDPSVTFTQLTGVETARDVALRECPEEAVDSWLAVLDTASEQGLLAPFRKTLLNAAAAQLAQDMDSLRDSYEARAALCSAIASERSLVAGIPSQDEPFYASKSVCDHLRGALLAAAFARDYAGMTDLAEGTATVGEMDPGLQAAAGSLAELWQALAEAARDEDGSPYDALLACEETVDDAVESLCNAGERATYLWWCLPPNEQQAIELLVNVRVEDRLALREDAAHAAALQAELDDATHQLALARRELAAAKKQISVAKDQLKAQERQAKEDVRQAEEEVRASRSYRLGNALGAPLRAARSVRDKLKGQ